LSCGSEDMRTGHLEDDAGGLHYRESKLVRCTEEILVRYTNGILAQARVRHFTIASGVRGIGLSVRKILGIILTQRLRPISSPRFDPPCPTWRPCRAAMSWEST
jgi:hypothetical protein